MHYDFHNHIELVTQNFLPQKEVTSILITSGASCPDAVVENVLKKLAGFYPDSKRIEDLLTNFL